MRNLCSLSSRGPDGCSCGPYLMVVVKCLPLLERECPWSHVGERDFTGKQEGARQWGGILETKDSCRTRACPESAGTHTQDAARQETACPPSFSEPAWLPSLCSQFSAFKKFTLTRPSHQEAYRSLSLLHQRADRRSKKEPQSHSD